MLPTTGSEMALVMLYSINMNNKFNSGDFEEYQRIINHVIEVSEVVLINLRDTLSYSFTVALDNDTFINVSKEYNEKNSNDVFQAINGLQEDFASYIRRKNENSINSQIDKDL